MEKQKTRDLIDDKYKWDLTTIYKTDQDWYKDYEILDKEITKIESFKGHILDSDETLLEYLKESDKLERKLYKLYYYAHLKYDQDTTNAKYQEMEGKITLLLNKYSELTSYVCPEFMQNDFDYVKSLIDRNPLLKEYEHNLENFYRSKGHNLSYEEERILNILSDALTKSQDTFEALTDTDIKFGKIKDENGKYIELTESNWSVLARSKDRNVRKKAFKLLYKRYSELKNTLASTFSGNIETLIKMAKIRNFGSSLEASLFNDNVTPKIYNNLIDTVHKNLDALYDYYKLKKEVLNLDELHLYDIYVPLDDKYNKTYTFEEARDLVFKALAPLGSEYLEILKKEFDEKWIDVYNNVGKRTGAYSSGFYDTNPFILLNYEGKLDDVSTLVHESGHSIHTYLSCKNNTYANSSYQIFVAEVASTVNEMLLRLYLIDNSKDDDEKLYILSQILELFKSTIFRQTMFAEFERDMHKLKEDGEILTSELLCNKYYELNKLYFGCDVVVDKEIEYEWERIPHFYYNFYVYKYAIGLAAACKIACDIYNKKAGSLEGYMKFLKSGGSNYPVEELKYAGIDVNGEEVIEDSIKLFRNVLDEYKTLKFKRK